MSSKPSNAIAVEAALDLLRNGSVKTVTQAASQAGAARTTVGDRWRAEQDGSQRGRPDDLPETPEEELIPVIFRDYSHLDELFVYPIGDIHVGASSYQEAKLAQWLSYLERTPNTSLLNTGDNINAAIVGSVSDVYSEQMPVGKAWRHIQEKFRPLAEADRIDAIGEGNHEARIYRAIGDAPMQTVAENLGVPYWSTAAMVVYKVGKVTYDVFVRHGSGGGATVGAKANKLQRQRNITPVADIYVSGHTHSQLVFPEDILLREGKRLVRRKQLFISSGSFLGLEAYAVVNGMSPTHIGAPRIRLDGVRRDPHVSV